MPRATTSRKTIRLVALLAALVAALLLPGLSQAATHPMEAASVSRAGLAPVLPPPSPAPQQAIPTATNTLTPTQQLQSLEQQLHEAYNRSDWAEVLRLITAIRAIDPYYKTDELREIEYQAHLAYGWDLMLGGSCLEALDQFRLALLIKPGDTQANQGLEAVARYCKTPVPTGTTSVTPSITPTLPGGAGTYVVQPGDTLYSIARRFNVSVNALMQANGLINDHIWVGQVLIIPGGAPPNTPTPTPTGTLYPSPTYGPPPATPGVPAQPIAHVVQPGETLCSLARYYHTSVWAIMAYNHLYTTTIWAYTVLYIPPSSQAGPVIHVVQPGNTLYAIARAYGANIAAIMAANGLHNATIYVGQRLTIPTGAYGWYPGYPTGDPCSTPSYERTYVIKSGDTLYSIARMFGTTVGALKAANGLVGDMIFAGTVIYIP